MSSDEQARPVWQRLLLVVGPAAIGIPLAFADAYIPRTLGVALCLLALYGLLPEAAAVIRSPWEIRRRGLRWLPGALPALVVFAVAAALLWPCLLGMMPQSQDHTVHLTRAWHFVSEMLGSGRLSGWSDLWFAGWPAGEDYPPGGDWWIGTVYLATFGLLGWEASYALAFLGVFAACGLAVYHFGKTYFGRAAALLAALFYLLDRGQYREGGWNYTVWWGVWPQILSTAFTLLSFSTLDRVLTRGRPRDFAICAGCVGFALLAHPVAMIYFGLGLPIYLAARALGTDEPPGRVVARAFGAFALGALLAAFWFLPFSAKSAWMAKYGELWKSLPSMADGILRGTLFDNITPPLVWLGVLGGALAAWRRSFAGIFLAGMAAVVLFVASSTAFQKLDLVSISPAFGQVQFQRLAIPAKVCLLLLAGYALQIAFARLKPHSFRLRSWVLSALLLMAVAPFVEPVLQKWGRVYGQVGNPKTQRDISQWNDYQAFLSWSRELKDKQDRAGAPLYRIAYVRPYNDHFFAAAPVYNHTPAYKVGFTPCTNFIHKPDTADATLYRLLQVKYVVSLGPTGRGTRLKLLRRFGSIYVYSFEDYSPQRYTLEGPGSVQVERFDEKVVRLKVSGAGPNSKLILHRANYPNWKATHDGQPLPIHTAAIGSHELFIGLPAKDGTIEVRYSWPAVNAFGALLSWLGVGVLLLMAASRFRPQLIEQLQLRRRLLPLAQRLERFGLALPVVAMGLLVVLLALRGAAGKDHQATSGVPKNSLLNKLDSAIVDLDRGSGPQICKRKNRRHECSSQSWNYVGAVSYRIAAQFRRCIWAHPVNNAKLRVRFPNIKLGRAISGHHGLLDDAVRSFRNGAPVTLDVAVDGRTLRSLVRPNARGWAHFDIDTESMSGKTATVSFTVTTRNAGGRHYCFEASIEP